MKWLLSLIVLLALSAESFADTYVYDQYGRLISVQRSAPRFLAARPQRNGNLRYVQSCPDGKCGSGFSGQSPWGGESVSGAPSAAPEESEQDVTMFRLPPRKSVRK